MNETPRTLEEAERQAQYMARSIGEKLPAGWGFVLVLGSLGEEGLSTYVSSVQRESAGAWLKEVGTSILDGGSPHRLNPLSQELDENTRWLLEGLAHLLWLLESPMPSRGLLPKLMKKLRLKLKASYPEICREFFD